MVSQLSPFCKRAPLRAIHALSDDGTTPTPDTQQPNESSTTDDRGYGAHWKQDALDPAGPRKLSTLRSVHGRVPREPRVHVRGVQGPIDASPEVSRSCAGWTHSSRGRRGSGWLAFLFVLAAAERASAAQAPPLRVFIRAGVKTHGPGEHDHPRFLEEWVPLLESRRASAEGALRFPTAEELERSDVLVIYAAEGASIHGEERARLERFLARGGGLVVLHDGVCGDDPAWFKTVAGGAWEHGRSKWLEGPTGLFFTEREHPITRGAQNFDFDDEIYWDLHLDPRARVLANGFHSVFDVTPQMWTFEPGSYRAFVSIQGHRHESFSHPAWRTLLLRGIAWCGRRDADSLVSPEEIAGLRWPPGGPLRPEESLASLSVEPGFQVSLVAAEPLVVKPISIDWDPDGRMWVAETPGYPEKERFSGVPAHDTIAILEDVDGDGRMDRRQVFADGLDLVTSLVLHQGGAIVSAAPDILWLRDGDGDGRAERREVLYTGFGFADTHAVISNLRWGLDGWIYGTQGYSGNDSDDVIGADGRHHGRIPNGLFRFRPDGSAIECVSSFGSNTWGLDFAWDHELFFTMANGAHLRHVAMDDAALARGRLSGVEGWADAPDHDRVFPISHHERAPYVQIDFVGGFTAASGCLVYGGGTWPSEYHGNAFVAEPTVNLVHRDVLEPHGTSFRASKPHPGEFLASRELWFRPVHLRSGPDGAIYVLDFYNQAVVHNDTRGPEHGPTNAAVRPDRDREHGRIWRVQHREARALPARGLRSDPLRSLESPNGWERMAAHRLLCESPEVDLSRLEALAASAKQPFTRVHALWVLAERGAATAELLARALEDRDAGVRKNAARIAAQDPGLELEGALLRRLGDGHPRARLEAILALAGRALRESVARALLELYPTLGEDRSRSAVLGALAADPSLALDCAALGAASAPQELVAELAVRAARAPAGLASALHCLTRLAPGSPRPVEAALLRLQRERAGESASPEARAALEALLASRHLEVATAALPLAARAGVGPGESIERLALRLESALEDPEAADPLRLRALRALLAMPDRAARAAANAGTLLEPHRELDLQLAAIEALGGVGEAGAEESAADALLDAWPTLGVQAREQAFRQLAERPAKAARLVERIAAGEIRPGDLGPQRLHRLRNHPDPEIARLASLALEAAAPPDRAAVEEQIERLAPWVEAPGDLERGRELFEQNCASCHAFGGRGGNVGPQLDGMGAHGTRELLGFVLDPNRAVEAAYLEYVARTLDGRLVSGVLVREDRDTVLLRGTAGDTQLRRDELEELRASGRSPMPTGFETLGPEGLRDLFAWLRQGSGRYRVVDLRPLFDASTARGLYDRVHDAKPMDFARYGVVEVGGVPFELCDPARSASGDNALVLRGGLIDGWESKTRPQRLEVPVGMRVARVHVLGGIAAWGWPARGDERRPIVRWTWRYEDGASEEALLHDGVEFADWIRRHDVPGSTFAEGLLREGSWGQLRTFALAPGRDAIVEAIVLESFDDHTAPTFLALTAELPAAGAGQER